MSNGKNTKSNKKGKRDGMRSRMKKQDSAFIDIGEMGDNVPHIIFNNERMRW